MNPRTRSAAALIAALTLVPVGTALAQSTGMPVFHAPYRAFEVREFGATASFPDGGGTAIEGHYRFGFRAFDVGIRGGFFDAPDGGDTRVLLGASARQRIITHTADFPLDGSVVVGIGGQFVEDFTTIVLPVGVALGRRLNVEGSNVSIVPYVQPTLFYTAVSNADDDVNLVLGFGADVRLSRVFDARVSVGLGDLEGVALSAVWVR